MRIVSIIPGIETGAPERTETSSGPVGAAEMLAGRGLEPRERLVHLGAEPDGELMGLEVGVAEARC